MAPSNAAGTAALNANLRAVFDKFDTDGSGAVSSAEMTAMVEALNLKLSAADITNLMQQADPDGSGDIEFEEFKLVMKQQLKAGGGGLSSVVTEASNAFGWMNPLSWFGPEYPDTMAPAAAPVKTTIPTMTPAAKATPAKVAPAKAASAKSKGIPKAAKSSTARPGSSLTPKGKSKGLPKQAGSLSFRVPSEATGATSRAQSAPAGTPVQRMKVTQAQVRKEYRQQAEEMRAQALEGKQLRYELQESVRQFARERVVIGHQQAVEKAKAMEELKHMKREMGSEMKALIEERMHQARQKKKEYARARTCRGETPATAPLPRCMLTLAALCAQVRGGRARLRLPRKVEEAGGDERPRQVRVGQRDRHQGGRQE